MVVVDSSGWVEFVRDGPKADAYAVYLKNPDLVITPTVVIYEVYKKLKRDFGQEVADLCLAQMKRTRLVPLGEDLALAAADLSLDFSLAMADSFVLAVAQAFGVELITSDRDLGEIPGVRIV